jgi:hypothetical protein
MSEPRESYVLSEGYHDRAFWSGYLLHLGCTDPGARPNGQREKVSDPFGVPVSSGHFAFRSKSGAFVRIVAARGKTQIPQILRTRLKESEIKRLARLVVNVDSDQSADGSPSVEHELTLHKLEALVSEFDAAARINADGDIEISGGETKISLVPWRTPDPATSGIPHQHTLERLICAALMAVYPNRGPAVQAWLDSRPEAPPAGPKEYAWSYLAGWHADAGSYEGFCSMIWKNELVVEQLRPRLEASGAWRVAQALAA